MGAGICLSSPIKRITPLSTPPLHRGGHQCGHPLHEQCAPPQRQHLSELRGSSRLVNGIEVVHLTHDACRRIIFTGQAGAGKDDWPAIIGTILDLICRSWWSRALHYLTVLSFVVRAGEDGQAACSMARHLKAMCPSTCRMAATEFNNVFVERGPKACQAQAESTGSSVTSSAAMPSEMPLWP